MAGKREAQQPPSRGSRNGDSRSRTPYFEEDAPRSGRAYDYEKESGYYSSRPSSGTGRAHQPHAYADNRQNRSRPSGGGGRPPHEPPRGNGGRKRKRRMPGWQKAIIIILVVVILLMVAAVAAVWLKLGRIDRIGREERIDSSQEDFDTDEGGPNTLNPDEVDFSEADVMADKNVVNILLIGRDARGSERGRSDSMILMSLNRNTKQISMVSLMRDSYVQIPGYSDNKLNAAYSFGGYELMDETISKNYGIEIDYNVGVNFEGFEQVIDKLGGIDVTLTSGEAEYMALWGYPDMYAGVNHMTGAQALCYARTRYVGTGKENDDFGRTYRQRVVMTTVYQEMMKKPLTEIWTILDSVMDCIETDMNNATIISLGTEFYNMGIEDLQSYRLPQDDEYSNERINSMAVLVLDWDKVRQDLQDWLYSDTPVAAHGVDAAN